MEIKSSTTTGKLGRKYRNVRSQDKAVSAMENNKTAENTRMSSQIHAVLNAIQNAGWAAGTPLP